MSSNLSMLEETNIRFEAILGIAALLMIIGTLAPWESLRSVSSNGLRLWQGKVAFAGSLLALFATTVSYRIYRVNYLQKFRPYTDGGLGMLGSILVLIGAFTFFGAMSAGTSPSWGLYLTIIAGFLGLFSSYQVYLQGVSSIPRGFSGKDVSP